MTAAATPLTIERKRATAWRILLGAALIVIAAVNSTRSSSQPGDTAGALGALTALVMLVGVGAWLIASGLPRSVAPGTALKLIRRRLWLKMAGGGFVLMVALSLALAFASFVGAGVLVTWAYWFGWTWISWLIADRTAVRIVQRQSADNVLGS